jgi:hypothetical protein
VSAVTLSPRENELLNAAIAYAERGFRVMPCAGKVPRLPRGLNDASAERDLVSAWWRGAHRGANIGLVVPEWGFVLDVDTAEGHADGADGLAALDRLEAEYGELPDTPRATTGRGGLHAFFKLPPGVVRGNDDKGLPAGLNVRAGGKGYIIAPPSMHPDTGRLYQWQTFRGLEHVELAELPPWLVRLTEPRHRPVDAGDRPPLPTTLPPRVRDVLTAAGLRGNVRPGPKGEGEVYVLSRCPACNDAHGPGRCYVTVAGRLKTHHAESCPAAAKKTDGRGLALREWIAAYAPAALHALEPATVGDIPGAVEAVRRDEPIYFCDAHDYPTAAAWSRAPENPDGGAALGVRSADELQAVAVRLFAALESAELAGKARVLCIPPKGSEAAMAAAADRLAGIGNVHLVHLSAAELAEGDTPPRHADDLASVARMGAHYMRVLFHRAELRHAAPLDVDAPDFNARLAELQRKALRDARRLHGLDAVTVFVTPPAAGKTTSMLGIAAETASSRAFWTADGRARSRSPRVIVALPDHANAAEKLAAFRKAYPDVTADHARGMLACCPLAADPEKRPAIERGAAILGRRMCEGCPLAGGCAGALAPRAPRNAVTFGAHAGIAGLVNAIDGGEADPPGPHDLVVIDEIPALVNVQTCGAMELRSLRKSYAARGAAWWHTSHTGHGDLAAELAAVADALDAATPRDEHAHRCTADDVLTALRQRPAALDAARRCLAEMEADAAAAGAGKPTPPEPTAEEARAGAVGERWPDAGAWEMVRTVAAALCNAAEDAPDLRLMCLRLEAWGAGWVFETRTRFELPPGVQVLALDADGLRRRHEWEALGAATGRPIHMVTVMVRGRRPTAAVHYRTERLRTRRLWARKGRRVAFLADARGAVANALHRAAGDVPCTLGVLTHKPGADALRWGRDLANDPDALPPDGAAFELDDCHASEGFSSRSATSAETTGLPTPSKRWTRSPSWGRPALIGEPRPRMRAPSDSTRPSCPSSARSQTRSKPSPAPDTCAGEGCGSSWPRTVRPRRAGSCPAWSGRWRTPTARTPRPLRASTTPRRSLSGPNASAPLTCTPSRPR